MDAEQWLRNTDQTHGLLPTTPNPFQQEIDRLIRLLESGELDEGEEAEVKKELVLMEEEADRLEYEKEKRDDLHTQA